jgi:Na+-driven multidrug efflux pump
MGKALGTYGLALANLLGGMIMALFLLIYIHTKTNFHWRIVFVTDIERQLLALLKEKLGMLILVIKQRYK